MLLDKKKNIKYMVLCVKEQGCGIELTDICKCIKIDANN